jgi:phosphotransferase system  glucose/maltose/N-acetylglucosamine-specific IIC component
MMSGYHLGKLVAPFTWIGGCNLQVLIAWLTEMLLPTIGAGKKGSAIQVMLIIAISVPSNAIWWMVCRA